MLWPACRRRESLGRCSCGRLKQPTSSTCQSSRTEAGENNGNWRGGMTYKSGYVMGRAPGHPALPLMRHAFELRDNVTVYDAVYVALAERLDCLLVTADQRLAAAPGINCSVEVLLA